MAKVMVIDAARCNVCNNYHIICQDENMAGNWVSRIPSICRSCNEAPCIKACTTKAIYKLEDGTVIIDPAKCQGHRNCINVCFNKGLRKIYFKHDSNEARKISYCGGC